MAAPMVSSLAALIKEVRPEFSRDVVRAFILGTAEDGVGDPAEDTPGYDIFMGHGRIRFDAALELATASIPCTLTTVTAAAPPPAAKKMLAPFVWLRDRQLVRTPLGRKLVADYYAASKTVAPVVGRDPELMVRVLACALDYGPVIAQLQKAPGTTVVFPVALWKESCAIAGDLLPKLDAAARKPLEPWVARGKKDPVGLLKELGIPAVLKDVKP